MSYLFSSRKVFPYLILLVVGTAIGLPLVRRLPSPTFEPQVQSPIAQLPRITGESNPNFVTAVVEQVSPAVVRIDSTRVPRNVFRDRVLQGTGSGFIFDANGLILTNAHVVAGADTVSVTLNDGRTLTGQVLGQDESADVAVVSISATNLPTVTLGNSAEVQPGEWAIAIGNPLGLDNTVTVGIISGIDRSSRVVGASSRNMDFIQTDAAINPGNSGGPLLNQAGQVIGINTAIIGRTQGLGFAIPINQAQAIAQQIVTRQIG